MLLAVIKVFFIITDPIFYDKKYRTLKKWSTFALSGLRMELQFIYFLAIYYGEIIFEIDSNGKIRNGARTSGKVIIKSLEMTIIRKPVSLELNLDISFMILKSDSEIGWLFKVFSKQSHSGLINFHEYVISQFCIT